jgi:hypothetical protein
LSLCPAFVIVFVTGAFFRVMSPIVSFVSWAAPAAPKAAGHFVDQIRLKILKLL